MLAHLQQHGKVSDRCLRLWACACVRQAWHLLDDPRSRRAVEVAERYADGEATDAEAARAESSAFDAVYRYAEGSPHDPGWLAVWVAATKTGGMFGHNLFARLLTLTQNGVPPAAQAALLRCVVGNPFRAVTLPRPWVETPCPDCPPGAPDENCDDCGGSGTERKLGTCPWLTPTVLALAWRAYDERDFGLLPVLADALEDAGCADAELLAHLRGPGPHARGCHALDLVLGKE
jgi:hypothetical protein